MIYTVAKITKVLKHNDYIYIFDRALPKDPAIVYQDSIICLVYARRTDYKRVRVDKLMDNICAEGFCIVGSYSNKEISKEEYYKQLGSLVNPTEEEIACYIKIINEF